MHIHASVAALLAVLATATPTSAQQPAEPPTPGSIIAAAPAEDWRAIDPADLLVMDLAPDAAGQPRRVVIQLLPAPFSQGWVENIRTLAAARWWDGTGVYRVVDNWVAQWGAGEDEAGKSKPLPPGITPVPETAYVTSVLRGPEDGRDHVLTGRGANGGREEIVVSRWLDPYAIGAHVAGWPVALDSQGDGTAWPVHCYGAVGVARDLSPDTGSGAELYAVIGHAPRQLDRNIAVVGRVIEGIEHLSVLPRGTGEAGVYRTPAEHTPIRSVRMGDALPAGEPLRFEYLATDSDSFDRYLAIKANRQDSFYKVPAGGVDLCNAPVPVRRVQS
ncbi:peptidylprolyl isomerase [Croceibacterium mercuriale]|uniref:Peptidylprolyl isomerase n=1 Tax=Croceibacterium mercuriale TaxID=1572751 RepID=A0A0B2BV85_9SPHN|nr:peptidylprolyl isomerase [Croceibacterium mercuriale]KHL25543.1 peptidylprolyl isomerase [Croceibacterium mercuriale]